MQKKINSLNQDEMVWVRYACRIKNDDLDFGVGHINESADEDADNRHYYCPKCDLEITDNYGDAKDFLLGKKIEIVGDLKGE